MEGFRTLAGVHSVALIDSLSGEFIYHIYTQYYTIYGIAGIKDLAELGYYAQNGISVISMGKVIIGSNVPNQLMIKNKIPAKPQDLIGQQVRISITHYSDGNSSNKVFSYVVSDVLKPFGNSMVDNAIYLPAAETERMKKWLIGSGFNRRNDGYDQIIVISKTINDVNSLYDTINSFGYNPNSEITTIKSLQDITALLQYSAMVLAVISLISCVTGIFLTMMNLVSERKTEIGLMKSVGATDKLILRVIVSESIIVGFLGGGIGIVVSEIFVWIGNNLLNPLIQPGMIVFSGVDFKDLSISIPFWLVITSPLLTAISSMFAGYIPASRAAGTDPIDALRSAE